SSSHFLAEQGLEPRDGAGDARGASTRQIQVRGAQVLPPARGIRTVSFEALRQLPPEVAAGEPVRAPGPTGLVQRGLEPRLPPRQALELEPASAAETGPEAFAGGVRHVLDPGRRRSAWLDLPHAGAGAGASAIPVIGRGGA